MKLLELEIENFGVFSGLPLQFGPGFQVVYGENEAGKSTLLQLIRELLFGFPHQSPYAFASHQGEMAATAGIELRDGKRIRFRRRKGTKDKVVGQEETDGQPIDEAELFRMLSHASPDLYQHVFGFSLSELSAGEKSLAHANLSEALYGGGLGGLATMQQVQVELKQQREGLYSPRGKNPMVNQLLSKARQTEEQLRNAVFKPRDFQQLSKQFEQDESRVTELRESLEQLRRQRAHWRRLSEALTPWLQRAEAEKELSSLEIPPDFPADADQQYRRCREQLDQIDADLADAHAELQQVDQALQGLVLAPELCLREAQIRHLQQQIGKIQGFRDDLPKRRQDAQSIRESVLAKLTELNPEWGLEHLEQFRSSLAQREAFQSARDQWDQLQQRKSQLEAQRPALLADIATVQRQLAELDAMQTVPVLEDLVERLPQYHADQQALQETDHQLQKITAEIQKLRTKLDAPLGRRISNAEKLSVPMEATVLEFRQRFDDLNKTLAGRQQQVEAIQNELIGKQQMLAELEAEQAIPSRQQLLAQRAHRDEGWHLIRQKYVLGKPDSERIRRWLSGDDLPLPDVYEHEVANADQLSDQLQADAETVARREQLLAEIDRVQQRVDSAQQQWDEARGELEELTRDWHGLWASCHFQPLSPDAMRDWLRLHAGLLDKLEEKWTMEVQRRDIEARVGDFEDELRDALPDMDDSPPLRLAEARRRVDAARQAAAQRQTYHAQLPRKTEQLQGLDHQLDEVNRQIEAWQQPWQSLLAETGFPTGWDVHVATEILNGIGQARRDYHQVVSLEQRVDDMHTQLAEFQEQVDQLGSEITADLGDLPPEDKVIELGQRLEAARQAHRDQKKLEEDRAKLQKRLAAKQAQRQEMQIRLEQLMQAAQANTQSEFHAAAAAAARHRQLVSTVETLTQQINTIRGTEDPGPFDAALAEADADSIEAQLRRLSEQITSGESEYQQANQSLGVHRDQLEKLDTTGDVLQLQMQLESIRGQLASAVDRWAPLVLAETLMQQAINRFEREHQPEMLRQVRQLFARMTRERYTDVRRKLDGTLLVEQPNGVAKEPHQLSRGTREQLYLAIRLAYVHHYSLNAEPLPLVMDDVLVNFDDSRALATLEVLWEIAESLQIIFLTCHQSILQLIQSARPDMQPLRLPSGELLSAS